MTYNDTIAAISTPAGEGGIGIVRVSGPGSLSVAGRVFKPSSSEKGLTERYLTYGRILDPSKGVDLDDGYATYMLAPASYTGHDVVELYCHGGALVLKRVLEAVICAGARLAEPGEFTRQAFLSGRLDLAQAEAVIDVIRAQTDSALSSARGRLDGALSNRVNSIKGDLLNLLTHLEAELDFPEDEVEGISDGHILTELEAAEAAARKLVNTFEEGSALKEGIRTIILGRPNVGKSSLLNRLLRVERAIVTDVPGTTRDVIEEAINLRGLALRLMDTAGLRETSDFVEAIGVKAARDRIEASRLVLFVVDSSGADLEEDLKLLEAAAGKEVIVVANKVDLVDPAREVEVRRAFAPCKVVFVSALNGAGLQGLEEAVYEKAMGRPYGTDVPQGELITSVRHKNSLASALEGLQRARSSVRDKAPQEIVSTEIRWALTRLGEITGEVTTEDILDKIFSEFCIGK